MTFMDRIRRNLEEERHVCVGLDTDLGKISKKIEEFLKKKFNLSHDGSSGPLMSRFNQMIVDATKDVAACYKSNRAFYEGYPGLHALQRTVEYIRETAPEVPCIFDAKYGDIGNTSTKSAHYAFNVLGADAVTANPYGGRADGIDAFLEYKDRGIFVWCLGSNEGSSEFQKVTSMIHGGEMRRLLQGPARSVETVRNFGQISEWVEYPVPLYQRVAMRVANHWNTRGNCGVVVGATNPKELKIVRELVGDMPILIPGLGAQDGDLRESVEAAIYTDPDTGEKSLPAIFNSSRGIIYASSGEDFAEVARAKVVELSVKISKILKGLRI